MPQLFNACEYLLDRRLAQATGRARRWPAWPGT